MRRPRARRSRLHPTLNRACGAQWKHLWRPAAQIRSVSSVWPQNKTKIFTYILLFFTDCGVFFFFFSRALFLLPIPLQRPVKQTVPCHHQSVPWRRRAPPLLWPSSGSRGSTWSHELRPLLGKQLWCVQFKYTHISLLQRSSRSRRRWRWWWGRNLQSWRVLDPRTQEGQGLMRGALWQSGRHLVVVQGLKVKVRKKFKYESLMIL